MISKRGLCALALTITLLLPLMGPAHAYPHPGRTERASTTHDGGQPNWDSTLPQVSADGRFVVFESLALNLVPGDSNARSDIFVHDRSTGAIERVSIASDGAQANGRSHRPAISADGRYVAFESLATNLVPGDTNAGPPQPGQPQGWDVFVHDRETGSTERVSVASDGAQGNHDSEDPSLSADGRFVVFRSRATNLSEQTPIALFNVYVHDRQTGVTEMVSTSKDGTPADGRSSTTTTAVSADGRYVVFESDSTTLVPGLPTILTHVYLKDRESGEVELVSASSDGMAGNESSFGGRITPDGRLVSFDSWADNLVPSDGNGQSDSFVRDLATAATERVSLSSSGDEANDASEAATISPDGRYVAFVTWADNFDSDDDNERGDVYLHDRITQATEWVARARDGSVARLGAALPAVSSDARVVAFQSADTGFVAGETGEFQDIFVRDRGPLVGIVDGPDATGTGAAIEVSGTASFSGMVVTTADDPSDDGVITSAEMGTELTGASISYRREQEDLSIQLRAHRIEGPLAPNSEGSVYGLTFTAGGIRYETRSAREQGHPLGRHALFTCDPVCVETAQLEGAIGTSGDEVLVRLPLEVLAADAGAELTEVRAFSGRGTSASGPAQDQDEVTLPDGVLPVARVRLGVAPADAEPSEVEYQVDADLDDASFSGTLPVTTSTQDSDHVWAEACLDEVCGAASGPVTPGDPAPSPTPSPSSSASATPSPTSSPTVSPSPSASASSTPSPDPSIDPFCPPGRKCETWSTQYKTASEGVGFPRGMAIAPDNSRVYLIGDYGPTFFERDLHTLAVDAETGEHLWASIYNGAQNNSETGWSGAATSDLVFAGGESRVNDNRTDLVVVAYDAATGEQRWEVRRSGTFDGLNQAKVMVVSPDERRLYVSGRLTIKGTSGDFGTFAFDAATGEELWFSSYNGTRADYDDPQGIALSPDGSRLFVTGHSWGRNSSFDYATVAYDTATGQQLWAARYDTDFQREFAEGGVVVSPDGDRVYVSGSTISRPPRTDDYGTVAYDAATGEQLWVSFYDAGETDRAFDIAMDPRGELVVVTGRSSDPDTGDDLTTVAYDAISGEERWVRRFHGPTLGGDDAGSAVQISPKGSTTFVTGTVDVPNRRGGVDKDAGTFAYNTSTGATVWEALFDGPSNQTDDPLNLAMASDGSWVYPGGLMMHSEGLGFSTLAQYFAVGYETGVSESVTPTQSPSPSATPTESAMPSTTPSPTSTATPSTTPSPTSTATPTPDPSETFTAEGTIDVSNPASAFVGGVTENEFVVTCAAPPQSQGLDGHVVEIPQQFGTGSGTAAAVGSNDVELYDLDLAFYRADCTFIDQSASAEPDEVADVPGSTRFIVVNASLGVDTSFVLTVTSSSGPSISPSPSSSVSPTPEPTEPPSERGVYPLTPDDPYFIRGGEGETAAEAFAEQWGPKKIQAPQAWQQERATGHGVNVAVIDSGLDLGHPDFACPGKIGDGAVIINGEVTRGARAQDIDGHGTHVAGIIGACTNNGTGTVGIAPDATIIPYRVFTADDEEAGVVEDIAVAIEQAADDGAHVINMSLGIGIGGLPLTGAVGYLPGLIPEIDDAIAYAQAAGVVVVAAAGNDAVLPLCEYPAIYEDVLCVGATDPRDVRTWYSTFPNKPDDEDDFGPAVVAPGGTETLVFCDFYSENILSTYARDLDDNSCDELQIGYDTVNGTSMASPHVAGVAALVYDRLGASRSATNATTVIDAIISSAVDLGLPGYDPVYAFGRVDALAAVEAVEVAPSPSPSVTESASPTPTATSSPTPTASPSPSESQPPDKTATEVNFTDANATAGQYSDATLFEARLTDDDGAAIAGAELIFEVAGAESERSFSATTDGDGVATVRPTLEEKPDAYQLTVRYDGDESHEPSADTTAFVVEREDTVLELTVTGKGKHRTLSARLSDEDTPSDGIADRTIDFYADGELIGTSTTNADGVATLQAPPRYRGGKHDFEARFSGDDYYLSSSDRRQT